MDELSGFAAKLGDPSMYRKFVEIFIGASVFLFAAAELEQGTYIVDQNPMACNMRMG